MSATTAPRAHLLLVEDDDSIAEPLVRVLTREGHDVVHVGRGADALTHVEEQRPDLVLLDLGLPDMDGLDVCIRLREADASMAVLMLTARAGELDEVLGLDAGADDYLTKPFALSVLSARVRSLLRRSVPAGAAAPIVTGDLRVEPASRRAFRGEEELRLAPKEFDLLAELAAHAGEVVTRDELMRRVWDEHWWGSTRTLDVHVGWLRRKLGDPPRLTTVRGVGFRLED